MVSSTPPTSVCPRGSGLLLHPTSLPSPYGIGDFGPSAYAWVDVLARAKQQWWQVLPLGPTGYGDSPYQSFSAFAGNTLLISPDELKKEGLLKGADLAKADFPADRVDYAAVSRFKTELLRRAWSNFKAAKKAALAQAFEEFCGAEASWLNDFALFTALKQEHEGKSWQQWGSALVERKPQAMREARERLTDAVRQQQFLQFLWARQWQQLKAYAHDHGVKIIGDLPIFVAADSADVWANPALFLLDKKRRPQVVAGVPPDYFSPTGQLWGNPLYDWQEMDKTGYAWWVARVQGAFKLADVVRIDHFRGFEAYWEVPGSATTAQHGRWVKAPGAALFDTLRERLGPLPIIAEDLGVITPEVEALRTRHNFPGMRILQFAFAGAIEDRFLPHRYEVNTVVYTGTHDNDTTLGWYQGCTAKERDFIRRYTAVRSGEQEICWDMIRLAWSSVAQLALAPLQDVLELGSQARMNLPGTTANCWTWRYTENMIPEAAVQRLAELTTLYGRASA